MTRVQPPGGWAADRPEPRPTSIETFDSEGRRWTATWLEPPFRPQAPDCNQAYGICFTRAGVIVLVKLDGDYWNLPGGGVEPAETLEDTLRREVREEACAEVVECEYIGCQRVDDPDHPDGPQRYYQARFWARVGLLPWQEHFEARERRLVKRGDFLATLQWGAASSAKIILDAGMRIEAGARSRLELERAMVSEFKT